MIRLTEGVYRIQVAERLSDDVVSDNQRRFGRDWIAATIQQAAAQPFVRSDVSLPPGLDQPLAGR
jgi:chromosome condensin MukBEF MukE localization factor